MIKEKQRYWVEKFIKKLNRGDFSNIKELYDIVGDDLEKIRESIDRVTFGNFYELPTAFAGICRHDDFKGFRYYEGPDFDNAVTRFSQVRGGGSGGGEVDSCFMTDDKSIGIFSQSKCKTLINNMTWGSDNQTGAHIPHLVAGVDHDWNFYGVKERYFIADIFKREQLENASTHNKEIKELRKSGHLTIKDIRDKQIYWSFFIDLLKQYNWDIEELEKVVLKREINLTLKFPGQELLGEKLYNDLYKEKRISFALLLAVMRFGKNFVSAWILLEHIRRGKKFTACWTSFELSNMKQIEHLLRQVIGLEELKVFNMTDKTNCGKYENWNDKVKKEFHETLNADYGIILFGGQDFGTKQIKTKYNVLMNHVNSITNETHLFVDESHWGFSKKSNYAYKNLQEFEFDTTLCLSGTGEKTKFTEKLTSEQIFKWGFEHNGFAKNGNISKLKQWAIAHGINESKIDKWTIEEWRNHYKHIVMPKVVFLTPHDDLIDRVKKDWSSGWLVKNDMPNITKELIVDPNGLKDIFGKSIEPLNCASFSGFMRLFHGNGTNRRGLLSYYMPGITILGVSNTEQQIMIEYQFNNNEYLKETHRTVYTNSKVRSSKELKFFIKKEYILAKRDKKKLIIIVVGQLVHGTSNELFDLFVPADNGQSFEKLIQRFGRTFTQTDTNSKLYGVMADVNIARAIAVCMENLKHTTTSNGKEEFIKEVCDTIDVFSNSDFSKEVSIEVLEKLVRISYEELYEKQAYDRIFEMQSYGQIDINEIFDYPDLCVKLLPMAKKLKKLRLPKGFRKKINENGLPTGPTTQKIISDDKHTFPEKKNNTQPKEKLNDNELIQAFVSHIILCHETLAISTLFRCNTYQDAFEFLENPVEKIGEKFISYINKYKIDLDTFKKGFESAIGADLGTIREIFSIIIKDDIEWNKNFKDFITKFKRDPKRAVREMIKTNDRDIKLFGAVFTPNRLIRRMLDKLPSKVWNDKSLTWLDPACGTSNFLVEIFDRLMYGFDKKDEKWNPGLTEVISDENERRKWILEKMLYGIDIIPKNVLLSMMRLDMDDKYELNIVCDDSLVGKKSLLKWDIKSDIIISNPPYQKLNENGKNWGGGKKLWEEFVYKSIDILNDGGYICIIHPTTWRAYSDKAILKNVHHKYNPIYINLETAKEYFDVGSRFDWYVLQKSKYTGITEVETLFGKTTIKITDWNIIPNQFCDNTKSIFIKCWDYTNKLNFKKNQTHHQYRNHVSNNKSDIFKYPIKHSIRNGNDDTVLWASKPHGVQYKKKIIISDAGHLKPIYDDGYFGVSQHALYMLVENEKEANYLIHWFDSKLLRFLLKLTKYSAYHNHKCINTFPYPKNLPENFIDENLYKYFNLTKDEIKFVEENV